MSGPRVVPTKKDSASDLQTLPYEVCVSGEALFFAPGMFTNKYCFGCEFFVLICAPSSAVFKSCQKARAYRPKVESNAVFMWQFSLAWCVLQGIFPKLHVLLRTPVKRVGGQTPGTARIDAGERVVHD